MRNKSCFEFFFVIIFSGYKLTVVKFKAVTLKKNDNRETMIVVISSRDEINFL